LVNKLALEQGQPCVPEHLVHDWERIRKATQEEIDAVVEVLKSGHFSIVQGVGMPNSEGLEREFAEYVGTEYCLAVSTGTCAVHCAVAGVGIEAGDEVIIPAYTFIASAMAVLHHNAIPIFVDVDPDTYLIDPRKIEEKITRKTKAIMCVHLFGLPCDMQEINGIARKHGLKVIEDSAQCYGAVYNGRKTGALGDAAGFAMTTTKQLMTGEGGLFTTNSKEVYDRASMTRLFGELADMRVNPRPYLSETIGWNYKMPEMTSALARVKLRHLDDFVDATRKNGEYLTQQLEGIDGLSLPQVPPDRTHTYYIYAVRVDPEKLNLDIEAGKLKDAVFKALAAENVKVGQWQKIPVPGQPIFKNKTAYGKGCPWSCHGADDVNYDVRDYPNTIKVLEDHFLVTGLVPPNGFELMDRYGEAFQKVFQNIDKVIEIYDETEQYVPLEERL
jgi:dTDP-4-amino-4,6-dideoxygalactose transaminase